MVKVNDKVVSKFSFGNLVGTVTAVYYVDGKGEVVNTSEIASAIKFDVNWGEFGTSKLMVHDQNVLWFKYLDLN